MVLYVMGLGPDALAHSADPGIYQAWGQGVTHPHPCTACFSAEFYSTANVFYNWDKYICQFGQIQFAIWTNTLFNLEKYKECIVAAHRHWRRMSTALNAPVSSGGFVIHQSEYSRALLVFSYFFVFPFCCFPILLFSYFVVFVFSYFVVFLFCVLLFCCFCFLLFCCFCVFLFCCFCVLLFKIGYFVVLAFCWRFRLHVAVRDLNVNVWNKIMIFATNKRYWKECLFYLFVVVSLW